MTGRENGRRLPIWDSLHHGDRHGGGTRSTDGNELLAAQSIGMGKRGLCRILQSPSTHGKRIRRNLRIRQRRIKQHTPATDISFCQIWQKLPTSRKILRNVQVEPSGEDVQKSAQAQLLPNLAKAVNTRDTGAGRDLGLCQIWQSQRRTLADDGAGATLPFRVLPTGAGRDIPHRCVI